MADLKIIRDWLLATQDAIFILQGWSGRLEQWHAQGYIEPEAFAEACRQLREAGLWQWAAEAGGHGIAALAEIAGLGETNEAQRSEKNVEHAADRPLPVAKYPGAAG
ncbi:MAG: hypothetical protein KJ077_21930 [Anaerolineae bacterium]|nr:hypothetical protein [Anaerolineae bacterium]